MIFGPASLGDDLTGTILAHSLKAADRVVPKGVALDPGVIAALREAGHRTITVARLEPGDLAEADAATQLGALLGGDHVRAAGPVHGRVNLFAERAGLLRLDTATIAGLNTLDEAITLGTLADATPVAAGDMLATLKIIPFAVSGSVMAAAATMLAPAGIIAVKPFRPLIAGLVLTRLPQSKDAMIRSTIEVTRRRIAARSGRLLEPVETSHETAPIATAIERLIAAGAAIILIAGASAVTDRADVAPSAIVRAGGHILRFGMPVDPGNLLCFGQIGPVSAVVLPGCARSPRLNGIDFVLDRVFAGETIDATTIGAMGIGGLLKDFPSRPAPRVPRQTGPEPKRVAALVLAAGRSSRAAPDNKLLSAMPDGRTLLAATVDHVIASRVDETIVVTGHQSGQVRTALAGRPVRCVESPQYAEGMAESLKSGIAALPDDVAAVLVCLGDMPLVDAAAIDRIIAAYDPTEGRAIVVPTHRGRRGNPILWDRRFFSEMTGLAGDTGARNILSHNSELIAEVTMDDDAVLRDFDTRDALAELRDPT